MVCRNFHWNMTDLQSRILPSMGDGEFANEKYKQSEGKLCIRPLKVNEHAISTPLLHQKKHEFFP